MMISLVKEVGRGKRGSRDLTYEEARQAAQLILADKATPVQIGAFLVAERIKIESADELLAFVDALRERSLKHPMPGALDCAGPYDGRRRTFMATLASAFVVAACGVPVTLHGSAPLPPKYGDTMLDVVERLGVRPGNRDACLRAAEQTGVLFAHTEVWCPVLGTMRTYREELGLRTVFNAAEKLLRPSEAPYMAVGVYHGTVFEKMAEVVARLGVRSGMILQGAEGSEDVLPSIRTRAYLVKEGKAPELYIVDPETFDLQAELPEEPGWSVERQAQLTVEVLNGKPHPAYFNMVLLNSALRLWTAQAASSVEEGIERALWALREGAAYDTFLKWLRAAR